MAASIIKLKRSSVPGKKPTVNDLPLGELGLNTNDGKVYIQKDSVGVGSTVIVVNPWSVGLGSDTYNTFFIDGSVGVGTTNPLGRLQVGAGTSTFIVTQVGTAVSVGIGTASPREVLDTILNQDASTTIQVQNDTDGTSANASVVARNNLGFFSFQLNSSARTATRLGSSIGGFAEIFTGSTFAGSGIKIGTANALPVIIGTNNAEALRIDSSQRVGIGTTNPQQKLDVFGESNIANRTSYRSAPGDLFSFPGTEKNNK